MAKKDNLIWMDLEFTGLSDNQLIIETACIVTDKELEILLEDAIRINEESGKLDSIEEIKDDGTVVFADYAYEIMKDTLGFDCRSFKPHDSENLAFEQIARFKELSNKYIQY